MRMRKLVRTGLAALAALSLAACGGGSATTAADDGAEPAAAGGELTLTLGHSYGVDSLPNRVAKMYAENVAEATDGMVTINVYPASQLGSWEEMQEGLEIGTVDVLIVRPDGDGALSRVLARIAAAFNPTCRIISLPRWLWRLSSKIPLLSLKIARLEGSLPVDSSRFASETNWQPTINMEQQLKKMLSE